MSSSKFAFMALFVGFALVYGANSISIQSDIPVIGTSDTVDVNGIPINMQVTHWRDIDGDGTFKGDPQEIKYQEKSHNIVVDQGLNAVECATFDVSCPTASSAGTFTPGTDYFDVISVGTGGNPTSGDTSLPGEITGSGLARTQVTPSDQGTGNATLSYTYTASSSVNGVSNTGLHWGTTSGDDDLIAGNTYQAVDLLDGDKLTITWEEFSYQ